MPPLPSGLVEMLQLVEILVTPHRFPVPDEPTDADEGEPVDLAHWAGAMGKKGLPTGAAAPGLSLSQPRRPRRRALAARKAIPILHGIAVGHAQMVG